MKVFYHKDADGHCAAAILWHSAVCSLSDEDMVSMDYNKPFPFDMISSDEQVWIVDFSIKPEEMKRLLSITKDVVWIDHHKSAIDLYEESDIVCSDIYGVRSVDASGCELTKAYLDGEIDDGHNIAYSRPVYCNLSTEEAGIVELIGDRDTWTFEYDNWSRSAHNAFLAAGSPEPWDDWWEGVMSDDSVLKKQVHRGEAIGDFQEKMNESNCKTWAYEAEFEGHTILVCNSNVFTSELFGDKVNDYPFVSVYCHNGDSFRVSLYSTQMDVVDYAIKRGGGGHPRACGFICEEVPYKKK